MRRSVKIIIIAFLLSFCITGACFSATGYYESRLYYLPKSMVNNRNVAIDLSSSTKSLSTSDYNSSDGITLLSSPNNLAMFRIMENIMPPKSQYSGINDTVSGGITLTITSPSNWTLVHESNPTQSVSFSLDAFCIESTWTPSQYDFVESSPIKLTSSTKLPSSNKSSTININGTTCTIFMPYTGVSNRAGNNSQGNTIRIPTYQRDYDICIRITGDITNLQSGYYYTTLNYETTDYYESPAYVYSNGNSISLPGNDDPSSISGTITVWAYIGDVVNETSGYNLSVSPSDDTYTMDLGISTQSSAYKVVDIKFYYLEFASSQPTESTEKNRFKIYISPTRDFTAGGTYQFIKMNTEGQNRTDRNTVYYDLYLDTSGSGNYKKFSALGNSSLNGTIGSAGVYTGTSGVSTTYQILPKYTQVKTGSSTTIGSGNNSHTVGEIQYMKTWELSQSLYLFIESQSLQATHNAGMYYSNIYVTLVAN